MSHFIAGKRHMMVEDTPAALDSLAMSCEMLAKTYGESSTECADAYFHYGKALLEMSRLESDAFGNALEGVPKGEDNDSPLEDSEAMTADEKEEISVQVHEALDENFRTHEKKIAVLTGKHLLEIPASDEESQDEEKDTDLKTAREGMDTDADKVPKEASRSADEEEPSNLQLAWEMLELAKVIYTKKVVGEKEVVSKAEYERKLCQTIMSLGEVSIENENYQQAVDDLTICLMIRQNKLSKDSRSTAEIHYQLGVALGFASQFEEAVKNFNLAIDILTTRIKNLAERTESKDETRTGDSSYSRDKEMAELEKLIPDIRGKIADTEEMKAEWIKKITESASGSSGGIAGDKPVSTIAAKKRTNSISQDGSSFSLK